MFLPPSGSATDPLLAQAPLGLVTSGRPEGGPLGTGRGAEPAGRAQTPLQAWGSRRLCSRPPSPVRSSLAPALRRRRHRDVTARDAPRHFLLPGGGTPAAAGDGSWGPPPRSSQCTSMSSFRRRLPGVSCRSVLYALSQTDSSRSHRVSFHSCADGQIESHSFHSSHRRSPYRAV